MMKFLQAATAATTPATDPAAVDAAAAAAAAAAPVVADSAALKAAAAAEVSEAHDLSPLGMFMQADIVVKTVMIILLISAVIALSLLFDKVMTFQRTKKSTDEFLRAFRKAQTPDEAAELVKKLGASPLKSMFDAGMSELAKTRDMGLYLLRDARDHTLTRVQSAMHIKSNHVSEEMGSMMTFLASIGSNAPFIGLFGTVWGILNSFIGIANSNTTSLAVVAPGIAEALLATAIGLAAAIPAVLIYNYSSTQIGKISGKMEDFAEEFLALVSRDMDRKGA